MADGSRRADLDEALSFLPLFLAAAFAAAFVLLGRAVAPAPTQADLDAARFAGTLASAGLGPLIDLFNRIGQAIVWVGVIVGIVIAFAVRRRWDVAVLVLLGGLSEVAVALSKTSFDRSRPLPLTGVEFTGADVGSYPSGHVTRVLVTLGVLALYATPRRWRAVACALVALSVGLMAIARIAVLEHWLTDTLGSLLLGAAWLALLGVVVPQLRQRLPPRAGQRP